MTADLSLSITKYAIPDDGWLRIDVRIEPLRVSESFYRVQEDGRQSQYSKEPPPKVWVWRKWSMAGKPTIGLTDEATALLNRLLFDHPVLSRILDQFGYSDGDAALSSASEPQR